MSQHLPDDALMDRVIPADAGDHGDTPCSQWFRLLLELLAAVLDELLDARLSPACSEPSRSTDIRIECAMRKFELCLKSRGELGSLAQLHEVQVARRGHRKHDATPAHMRSYLDAARELWAGCPAGKS